MTEPKQTFVVERARWQRGDDEETYLLNTAKNAMCCLGFVCLQLGLGEEAIKDISDPCLIELGGEYKDKREHRPSFKESPVPLLAVLGKKSQLDNTELAKAAIKINDDPNMADSSREHLLSTLFAEHGYEMVFR